MTPTLVNPGTAVALIALALPIGAMGFYVANADDAPGASVVGLLLLTPVVLGVKAARKRRQARRQLARAVAFSSTPSDLVRFGLARGGSVNGELAGGMVTSLMTRRDAASSSW